MARHAKFQSNAILRIFTYIIVFDLLYTSTLQIQYTKKVGQNEGSQDQELPFRKPFASSCLSVRLMFFKMRDSDASDMTVYPDRSSATSIMWDLSWGFCSTLCLYISTSFYFYTWYFNMGRYVFQHHVSQKPYLPNNSSHLKSISTYFQKIVFLKDTNPAMIFFLTTNNVRPPGRSSMSKGMLFWIWTSEHHWGLGMFRYVFLLVVCVFIYWKTNRYIYINTLHTIHYVIYEKNVLELVLWKNVTRRFIKGLLKGIFPKKRVTVKTVHCKENANPTNHQRRKNHR